MSITASTIVTSRSQSTYEVGAKHKYSSFVKATMISREAVENVSICLSQYWKAFSKFQGKSPSARVWRGPDTPESAPYDIMCPTPARSEEEEQEFRRQVQEMIDMTDLSAPGHMIQTSDDNNAEEVVDDVLSGAAWSAVISGCEMMIVEKLMKQDKVLILDITEERQITLTIKTPGSQEQKILDNEESLIQTINMKLLPELYQNEGILLVKMLRKDFDSDATNYLRHQASYRKHVLSIKD